MAAVVNWQISVFHVFPFFAPCIAIFSTMRYPSATSSTIITLKPTAKKHRADVRVPPLRHFQDQRLHHHIQHGSGGKAEQIGQGGHHDACRQDRQHCPDRTENVLSNQLFRFLRLHLFCLRLQFMILLFIWAISNFLENQMDNTADNCRSRNPDQRQYASLFQHLPPGLHERRIFKPWQHPKLAVPDP